MILYVKVSLVTLSDLAGSSSTGLEAKKKSVGIGTSGTFLKDLISCHMPELIKPLMK